MFREQVQKLVNYFVPVHITFVAIFVKSFTINWQFSIVPIQFIFNKSPFYFQPQIYIYACRKSYTNVLKLRLWLDL